ncbi:MAG: hypothetical protein COB51_11530 [Moraxellaceae bacterium]|nr:MAG: hypothetical protein COB51_11530 [Moraxellaceae bacterium]
MLYPRSFLSLLLLITLNLFSISGHAEGSLLGGQSKLSSLFSDSGFEEPEFLDVDDAFVLTSQQNGRKLNLSWKNADGYYLYKDRFKFSLEPTGTKFTLSQPTFSNPGKEKDDAVFGLVQVYYHDVTVNLSIEFADPLADDAINPPALTLVAQYQGCADAGLCYPPQKRRIEIDLGKLAAMPAPSNPTSPNQTQSFGSQSPSTQPAIAASTPLSLSVDQNVTSLLKNANLFWVLLTLYLLGLGLSFTPCVLPMVPILTSIIAGQEKDLSTAKAFTLSLVYVLSMALTYALAGVLVGYFGQKANIQMYLQSPAVLISFAAVFVLLAFSMFGFYELKLPSGLQNRLDALNQKQQGGKYIGVALMGVLSALVVSPCVSAPLIGVLTYISTTGDGLFGGISLFALALGMGTPLILIGTSGGKLLPKAGAWMEQVKAFFGLLLLAVGIWLLERIIPGALTLFLWGSLLLIGGVYLGAFTSTEPGWGRTKQGVCILAMVYGVLLIIGAASGQEDPLRPLHLTFSSSAPDGNGVASANHRAYIKVDNLQQLEQQLALAQSNSEYVMLDFYADWCISCKVFERQVFANPQVQDTLKSTRLLQADLSDLNADGQQLLQHFGLFGLPAILFFGPRGAELIDARVQGEMHAAQFLNHLQTKVFGATI